MTPNLDTVNIILASLKKFGIVNAHVQTGILAVVQNEGSFTPHSETGYANTPNDRIRAIFGTRVASFSDAQLSLLKSDDRSFFSFIYANMYGNNATSDGYTYRGRGFNQITFKDNYAKYGKMIGVDLVSNPDLLNNINVAADALAAYFADLFAQGKASGYLQSKIGVSDVNQITDDVTGTKAAFQANAGWKTNTSGATFQAMLQARLVSAANFSQLITSAVKNNPGTTAVVVLAVAAVTFFFSV